MSPELQMPALKLINASGKPCKVLCHAWLLYGRKCLKMYCSKCVARTET